MEEMELVQRLKEGDRDAFDALYEKYANILLRMAYLVCGSRADAEDIVQETFVKCWFHIGELKKPEGFRSWLYQILYRTAYRQCKKSWREIPDETVEMRADTSDGVTSLDRVMEKETAIQVKRAVERLDFRHRAVVVLYYYNGSSIRDIAHILNCTEGTVKSRLFAARKKLRGSLNNGKEGGAACETV